jgi:hypothetical protein
MDVTIGEVQARVEASPAGGRPQPEEGEPRVGVTEKAREARLADRRAQRVRERLNAT